MKVREIIEILSNDIPRTNSNIRHVWTVFWANFKIFLTYRTWVTTETVSTVTSIFMYSLMGIQVSAQRIAESGYGSIDWISFALIGVATANYLWMCISRISHAMQHEIQEGTLETIISSMILLRSYIAGQSIRGFLVSSYFMIGTLLIGVFVLQVPLVLNFATTVSFTVAIFMMILSYLGIGITAAGVILVYKKGDPLTFVLAGITEFFGGVLFPLQYLKAYPVLWNLAWFMPYTYALDASRRILLLGETILTPIVLKDLLILGLYSVIFIPIGLWIFRWGINRIRDEGTVATY